MSSNSCYLCGSSDLILLQTINKMPELETDFGIPPNKYCRRIFKCNTCSVYNNFHGYDLVNLYCGGYNKVTYQNQILNKYDEVMKLPYEKSDNKQRVTRIISFLAESGKKTEGLKVLDVGSGLCVFLGEMMKYGIEAHCIDPDFASVEHALKNVHVKSAYIGLLEDYSTVINYDLISFNKVLEHVLNPIELLKKAKSLLNENGIVYIELPDGDNASRNGGFINREEFYLEHYTSFDSSSVAYLAENSDLNCNHVTAIHEPSDKYTVYAFAN